MGDGRVNDSEPNDHRDSSYLICFYLFDDRTVVFLLSF